MTLDLNSLASLVSRVYLGFGGMGIIAFNQGMHLSLCGNCGGTSLDQANACLFKSDTC